jgi:8-oxo-dGTP pyrophosphatase MutT (NUDIX family)
LSVEASPAATVVLLRDGADGVETLLLRRNPALAFHGGAWVFPGGRIDAADATAAGTGASEDEIARVAAVREAREETGLTVEPAGLVPLSHWTTPPAAPKRFATWFFLATIKGGELKVDGSEICEHRWMRPAEALSAQRSGSLVLPAATFVTLHDLQPHPTVEVALRAVDHRVFEPRPRAVEGGTCSLYGGDSAYDGGELDVPGPRHRLWMLASGWRYERLLGR